MTRAQKLGLLQASLHATEQIPRSDENSTTLTFLVYTKCKVMNVCEARDAASIADSLVSLMNDKNRFAVVTPKIQARYV